MRLGTPSGPRAVPSSSVARARVLDRRAYCPRNKPARQIRPSPPERPAQSDARARPGRRGTGWGAYWRPRGVFHDRTLTCRDCSDAFVFSSGEQQFFASKGLTNDPQRCPTCRAAAKRARSTGGPGRQPRVPRRDLQQLRRPGRRPVPAAQRPPGLLLDLLRQGPGRGHRDHRGRHRHRTSDRSNPGLCWAVSRRRWVGGRDHRARDGRDEPEVLERCRPPGGRDGVEDGAQHPDVEVVKSTARIEDGEVVEYQVQLKIGFEYEG